MKLNTKEAKRRLAYFEGNAEAIAREHYSEYVPDDSWPCPCCGGDGEIRLRSERTEKRRITRRDRFRKRANRERDSFENILPKYLDTSSSRFFSRPYFRLTDVAHNRMAAFSAGRTKQWDELCNDVTECTAVCPVCCECEAIDDEYRDKISEAIEKEREYDDEYHRSEDYGGECAYIVEPYYVVDRIGDWFVRSQSFSLRWKDIPAELRNDIALNAIDVMESQFVSGYSSGFDCDFDSFSIGESEIERNTEEFLSDHGIDDCPERLLEENSELNYSTGRYGDYVRIYNCCEYDHWAYGLDDEPLANVILESLPETCEGIKRRELQTLRDELREIAGDEIELSNIDLTDVYVCYSDSVTGGNCRPGTQAYMAQHNLSGHCPADQMPEPHLREVRKAIRSAVRRHQEEMTAGYCELEYHQRGNIRAN